MNVITHAAITANLAALHFGLSTASADARLAHSAYHQGKSRLAVGHLDAVAALLPVLQNLTTLIASLERNLANPPSGTQEPPSDGQ